MKKIMAFALICVLFCTTGSPAALAEEAFYVPTVQVAIIDYPASVFVGSEFTVKAKITADIPMEVSLRWLHDGTPLPYSENPNLSIGPEGCETELAFIATDGTEWTTFEMTVEVNYLGEQAVTAQSQTSATCEILRAYTAEYRQKKEEARLAAEAAEQAKKAELAYVNSLVSYPYLHARMKNDSPIYRDASDKAAVVGQAKCGNFVYYRYEKKNPTWAYVECSGVKGWVLYKHLTLLTGNECNKPDLTDAQKELYINSQNLTSQTSYLVWVNLERTRVNVFLKEDGQWELCNSFFATIGANPTTTITGEFEIIERLSRWTYPAYYCGPVLRFYNGYAFHSTLIRYDGTPYDDRLGETLSLGCIRLAPEDIKWMVDYVPIKTKIFVK